MDISTWITPALLIGLFAWLRIDLRDLNALRAEVNKHFDNVNDDVNRRFDSASVSMNRRFDDVTRELADQRERMARLEGALEGFFAGRRDRDPAA